MLAEQVSLILASAGLSLGILICFILLLANKTQVHANRILAVTVFSLSLAMIQAVLIYSRYILVFPNFFRLPSPFFYLSLSTSYLYVRAVINDETRFKKFDFLFFIPAILHLGEMLPFYLKPASEKRQLIARLLQDPNEIAQLNEGILPPYMHNMLRSIIGLVFVFLMIRLLVKMKKEGRAEMLNSATFTWLKWFTALVGLAIVSIFFILLVPQSVSFNKSLGIHLSVIVCFVILNFYLFFRPQILYGLPRLRMETIKMDKGFESGSPSTDIHGTAATLVAQAGREPQVHGSHSSLDYLIAYKPILELHLENNKPYLQQGYNIAKLSLETGIPQHHLSALLNKVYGVRFNDFINNYRIKHITDHFAQSGWHQMTLEGIASEAGFNSRTTFFNAIKKSTGLSPSEFISKIKNERNGSGSLIEN
jgi:AraC-like DNA-binding protein